MSLLEELAAIREKRGALTPAAVVEEAKDPQHPLHSRFEWDDSIAGDAYRRQQAHELIRSVRIIYSAQGAKESNIGSVRAFHAIRHDHGFVYEPAEKIAVDPVARAVVLAEMRRDWLVLRRRYQEFSEFAAMVSADLGELATG